MSNIIIPTSPADRNRIRNAMKEISASFTRTDAEKDFIKDAIHELSEDVAIPKKILRKMAVIYHKQNMTEVTAEAEDLEALYILIDGGV